jgi:serine/threonine protein kinase
MKIIQQLANGIKALHSLKYVHRDLKPENIFVTMDGQYKISEFTSATTKFYDVISNNVNIK